MSAHIGERIGEDLLDVLSNLTCILGGAADTDAIVGSIALHEKGRLGRVIQLLLKLFAVREAVELERAGVLLLRIELFAESFWEHLVNSEVCQEKVVIRQELSLIFKLFIFLAKFRHPDHLSDGWNI